MPSNVLVYSIPGSGSRFTISFLEKCLGLRSTSIETLLLAEEGPQCALLHATEHKPAAFKTWNKGHALSTVIPLRHPVDQYLTRKKSFRNDRLARNQSIYHWATMMHSLHLYHYQILPIDTDIDHTVILRKILQHVKFPVIDQEHFDHVVKEWPKVGESGASASLRQECGDWDLSFLDFAVRWYEEMLSDYKAGIPQ